MQQFTQQVTLRKPGSFRAYSVQAFSKICPIPDQGRNRTTTAVHRVSYTHFPIVMGKFL